MILPIIEVIEIEDQPDGTTRVVIDLDEEATSLLLSAGLEKILTDHLKEQELKTGLSHEVLLKQERKNDKT